jgi:fused signal recognition particle receptor
MVRALSLALIGSILIFSAQAFAQEQVDATTDVEELMADSDAATALAIAARKRATQERAENARLLRQANKAREVAEAKRHEANVQREQTEAEIDRLLGEQRNLKKDLRKSDASIQASEQAIQQDKARVEQAKQATNALVQKRTESELRLKQTEDAQNEIVVQTQAVEKQKALIEAQLEQALRDEKIAKQELEKTKVDEARRQAQLTAQIAELKERYRQAQERAREVASTSEQLKRNTSKLEQVQKVGVDEVERAEGK